MRGPIIRPVSHTPDPVSDPFVTRANPRALSTEQGPLSGESLAVKDNIDAAGLPTNAGNPHFGSRHGCAARTAPALATLQHAGATLVGKTIMDEFAYGADGVNAHYGTPLNPRAPSHTCGGSSCGSASAVAAGLASIGVGTDTGGSTRIPPAATGLFGLRPTHGRVSATGVVPLAPSFDTIGWMTRDADTLARVSAVLLPALAAKIKPLACLAPFFAAADPDIATVAVASARRLGAQESRALPCTSAELFELYVGLTRAEIRSAFAWLRTNPVPLGDPVERRFAAAFVDGGRDLPPLIARREELRQALAALLKNHWLVFPTLATRTPLVDADLSARDQARARILPLTVLAPLVGAPEITLPVGSVGLGAHAFTVGLSVLGAADDDLALCQLAQQWAQANC